MFPFETPKDINCGQNRASAKTKESQEEGLYRRDNTKGFTQERQKTREFIGAHL